MEEIMKELIEKFLKGVMTIERRYANELKNAKSARQSEIKEYLEKFAVKELEK